MTPDILDALDAEIARLQQVRSILSASEITTVDLPPIKKGPGRPKASKASVPTKKSRQMSDEGRARIAAAQMKRWAAARKSGKR